MAHRIFESFWQLQESQKQNSSGLGLGLSLVQRSVSSFKGKIHFTSSEEAGTFFKVVLPYVEWQDPVKLNLKLQQVQSMNMKYAQDLRSLYELERKKNAELDKLSRDLAEKQERLNLFLSRLLTTQEEERRSISRDLHDGLAQTLTFANQMTEIVELEVPQVSNSKAFTRARDGMKAARTEIRRLVAGLRPDALDRFGLIPALRDYFQALAREQGWKTSFEVQGDFGEPGHSVLSTKVEENFFRIAQEALSNIARHAHTNKVAVQLILVPSQVSLLVQDWGVGFKLKNSNNRIELDAEPNAGDNKRHITGHFGLIGVEERIRLLGGTLDIKSEPGEGTTLCARVPL
jgi:signal transduction histidine kinase